MAGDGRLTFTPAPQVAAYLRQLKKRGFYGKKMGDVINHILQNEITELLKSKMLDRLSPEEEGTDDEDEEEGPARKPKRPSGALISGAN